MFNDLYLKKHSGQFPVRCQKGLTGNISLANEPDERPVYIHRADINKLIHWLEPSIEDEVGQCLTKLKQAEQQLDEAVELLENNEFRFEKDKIDNIFTVCNYCDEKIKFGARKCQNPDCDYVKFLVKQKRNKNE